VRVRRYVLTSSVALAFAVALATAVPSEAATGDWPSYLGGPSHHSRNVGATAITPSNVSSLGPAWTFHADAATQPDQPAASFLASPTVSNGVVFIGSSTGVFYAVDAQTGTEIWHQDLGYVPALTCPSGRGIVSTATVADDPGLGKTVVYVGGGDGNLYALDAANGGVIWSAPVVQPGTTENEGYNWASPVVVGDHVYMGISSNCDRPLVRGGVKMYDRTTGARLATHWTVPKGSVGGSVWTTPAATGSSLWMTTGNGEAGDDPGESFSIVRLDQPTLETRDLWTVPTAHADMDFGSSPTRFLATIDGEKVQMIGACSKNGKFYALEALSLEDGPVWSRRLGITAGTPGAGSCLPAAIFNATAKKLYTGSNQTTVNGVTVPAALRALSPATGRIAWETALPSGPVMGSPTLDGSGVIAAATYSSVRPDALYLVDASDGSIVRSIDMNVGVFAQPVFAGADLFVATTNNDLICYSLS
jgi:polyvinyl alcohol dehydrogenase (cytochrome)